MSLLYSYQFLKKIMNLPFIEEIWLFGSRARGDSHERSDLDLSIICPKATDAEWEQVLEIVEGADTLLKVDVVRFDQLKEDEKIKENILRFKKILYQRENHYMDKALWEDYFENLGAALARLKEVLLLPNIETVDYLQDAAIQRFEFTIELYWKVLKKFLSYEKIEATSPREVMQKAYQFKLIHEESAWLAMLDDRNKTSHVYKKEEAKKIFDHIKVYFPVMETTYQKLEDRFKEM
jgi:nucleotidyltransferase substrate binding protein (TIGR01987 family)